MPIPKIEIRLSPDFYDTSKTEEICKDIPLNNPLTRNQEFHLFRRFNYLKYKKRESESLKIRNIIVVHNIGLLKHLSSRISKNTNISFDDIFSQLSIKIISSINSFDFNKGFKFSTYFKLVAEREFQGRRFEKRKRLDSLCPTNFDLPINDIQFQDNDLEEKDEKMFLINEIKTKLENFPENYKKIITEIYFKGKTEHQLAKERKCCRNNINLIKKRALTRLRKMLKVKQVK